LGARAKDSADSAQGELSSRIRALKCTTEEA
jgi:hypothetical protein